MIFAKVGKIIVTRRSNAHLDNIPVFTFFNESLLCECVKQEDLDVEGHALLVCRTLIAEDRFGTSCLIHTTTIHPNVKKLAN